MTRMASIGTVKLLMIGIVLASIALLLLYVSPSSVSSVQPDHRGAITTFDECVAAGYPVMESYPERCMTTDGRSFERDISNDMPDADGTY